MINQKEDKGNFFGTALFIMLFFLFVSSHSDTVVKHSNETLKFELISEFHSSPLSADIVNVISLPLFHKNWMTSQDRLNLRLYDGNLKICTDNRTIIRRLTALQKEEFLTKHIVFYRYYSHLFSLVDTDLPGLS